MEKKNYWLLKSEPSVFSINDLEDAPKKTSCWDGVRNYQARNFLRDSIKSGDLVLFYHSNAEPPGIAGLAEVVKAGYPDATAFDPENIHYDPKSSKDSPTWYMIDIKHVRTLKRVIGLEELRHLSKLKSMVLLQKGSRLSVQPVSKEEWDAIIALVEKTKS